MVFFRERVNGLLSLNARNGAKRRGCSSAVSGQRFFPLLLVLTASCLATFSVAAEDFTRPPAQPFQEPAFLPVDDAFAIRAELADSGAARITWDVAPDYYLYRHQFSVRVDGVKIDQLQIPSGQEKFDEFFGDVEVYYQFAELTLSETRLDEGAPAARVEVVDVAPLRQQKLGALGVAPVHRAEQRHAVAVVALRVGPCAEEQLHALEMALVCCDEQRGAAVLRASGERAATRARARSCRVR